MTKPTHYRSVLREEAPNDDGSPTGRVFVYTQRLVGVDDLGEDEWTDVEIHGPYCPTDRAVVMRAKQWSESK